MTLGPKNIYKLLSVVIFSLIITTQGCGGGRTIVINRPDKTIKATSLYINSVGATVDVPEEVKIYFERFLTTLLFEGDPNSNSKITYFNSGSDMKS